jgi:hypothetical protein
LQRAIPVYNIDGTPNEAGAITEVLDVTLRFKDHTERTQLAVTGLGKQNIVLGFTWLKEHNPEVDWTSGEVKMSRCPTRCRTCQQEATQERKARKFKQVHICACRMGPIPDSGLPEEAPRGPWVEDVTEEDEEELEELPELVDMHDELDDFEDGDRIFVTTVPAEAEFVRASSNVSQRLSEAFLRNQKPKSFRNSVPDHLYDFEDVFSKTSFDKLPDERTWDHAIELIPDATPAGCKVYPLSPKEQKELDVFLEENLATGRIRPSKSPMASPVFFIKKKDGSLLVPQPSK